MAELVSLDKYNAIEFHRLLAQADSPIPLEDIPPKGCPNEAINSVQICTGPRRGNGVCSECIVSKQGFEEVVEIKWHDVALTPKGK